MKCPGILDDKFGLIEEVSLGFFELVKFGFIELVSLGLIELVKFGLIELVRFGLIELVRFGLIELVKLGFKELVRFGLMELVKFGLMDDVNLGFLLLGIFIIRYFNVCSFFILSFHFFSSSRSSVLVSVINCSLVFSVCQGLSAFESSSKVSNNP